MVARPGLTADRSSSISILSSHACLYLTTKEPSRALCLQVLQRMAATVASAAGHTGCVLNLLLNPCPQNHARAQPPNTSKHAALARALCCTCVGAPQPLLILCRRSATADALFASMQAWNANALQELGLVEDDWMTIKWETVELLQYLGLQPWYAASTQGHQLPGVLGTITDTALEPVPNITVPGEHNNVH